ncbi:hypothetical protein [Streptomyces sp. NPDC048825]|uniref:hypothetical protein n=1 Tax=Streptomyces sp. NPDC048825 TaxID=3365592 RepID=UPI00371C4BD0
MSGTRYFSVGCLVPRIHSAQSLAEWLNKTKEAFESIPSVQDLSFTEIDDLDYTWQGEIGDPGDADIPIPEFGMMAFRVHIPTRLQRNFGIPLGDDEVEDFSVLTFFDPVHPVTFVECGSTAVEIRNPAASMVIVREFLEAELAKAKSEVSLFRVGPSPFHVDFFLSPGRGEILISDHLSARVKRTLAYDRIDYFYSEEAEASDSLLKLFEASREEFSYFYQFESLRNSRLRSAGELSAETEQLTEKFKERGFKAYLYRTFSLRHRLQAAHLDAISARLTAMRQKKSAKEDLEGLYSNSEGVGLKIYLERVTEEEYLDEIESSEKILEIIDARHSQEIQRFATISFSLLGVVVGALITAALRSWWG